MAIQGPRFALGILRLLNCDFTKGLDILSSMKDVLGSSNYAHLASYTLQRMMKIADTLN
jgi:hypothetical protein